jgi:hypothetical protein
LEPSVQSKPSFEEAGLVRGGVVETMAPLGALPKARKANGENGVPTRKIILKTSGTAAGKKLPPPDTTGHEGGHVVGMASPAASPPASPLFPPGPTNKRKSLAAKVKDQDAEDEEYDPKGDSRRRRSRRVSLPVKKPAATIPALEQSPPARERRSSGSIVPRPATPGKHEARSQPEEQGFTDKVVAAAVDEALKHYRYPTAWALKTLYEEKSGDRDFVAMVQDIFSQTADEETMAEFFKQMEERKREGKKDNRGCYSFVPPATNSRFTPHKPMAAPYADLIHEPEELPQKTRTRATKKAKTSHGGGGGLVEMSTSTGTPRRNGHGHGHGHGNSKGKGKGNGAGTGTGGVAVSTVSAGKKHSGKTSTGGIIIKVKTPASRKRARRDSGSSDSSLSTAISMSSPEVRASSLTSPSAFRGALGRPRLDEIDQQGEGGGGGGGGGGGAPPASARAAAAAAAARGATTTTTTTTSSAASTASTASSSGASTGAAAQPITTRGKSSKQAQSVSNSSRSNSPSLITKARTRPHKPPPSSSSASAAHYASMPGRVSAAELFPNLSFKSAEQAVSSAKDAELDVGAHMPEEDEDSFWDRRRTARGVTNSFSPQESSVRGLDAERETTPVRKGRRTRQSLAASATTRATRSASKRPNDDGDRTLSPVAFSLAGDGSSTVGSRAATPTSLRPAKKQKTGLRVKTS